MVQQPVAQRPVRPKTCSSEQVLGSWQAASPGRQRTSGAAQQPVVQQPVVQRLPLLKTHSPD
jgi:hypothetical protein